MNEVPEVPKPAEAAAAAPAPPEKPTEPVLGVTVYDRVLSFLLTLILIMGFLSAPFAIIWLSNQDWSWLSSHPVSKIEMVDVLEDVLGGGEEDGLLDSSLYAPGPEGPDVSTAVNPDDVISDTPAMEERMTAVLNAVGAAIEISDQLMMGTDVGSSALPSGNPKGKGTRRNLGKGPGDGGGVKRSERWEIMFPEGQTEGEYAKQLDFFRVELGAIVGNQLYKVSNLSRTPVVKKVPNTQDDKTLYFSWRGGARRQIDLNLLKKAQSQGLPALEGSVIVLQFYPPDTENKLAIMERDFAVKTLGDKIMKDGKARMEKVRKTKFSVVPDRGAYGFEIAKQEYFGQPPSK